MTYFPGGLQIPFRVWYRGMETKIKAARIVARLGIDTIIASGFEIDILLKIKSKNFVGTTILSGKKNKAISARKQWMLNHIKAKGKLYLDSGAINALVQYNKSLTTSWYR